MLPDHPDTSPLPVSPPATLAARGWRLLRHLGLNGARRVARELPAAALARLGRQIAASEQQHSAELRLCVEASLPPSYAWRPQSTDAVVQARALSQFAKLRVWDTEANNGVLIYLLLPEHAIEIVADRAAARAITPAQWQHQVIEAMRPLLRQGQTESALTAGIAAADALLRHHFPPRPGQPRRNELPDQPTIG